MRETIKMILVVIIIFIGIIVLDTIQARVLKNSPIISWKEYIGESDSWVDRGIVMDTYYCVKDQKIVSIEWTTKLTKYSCPIQ